MGKTLNGFQTNFTAGELSPRLAGHIDINKYANGLKTGRNCICLPHGPVKRRNGTQFINEIKDSSTKARLFDFQFNETNAYLLEFGNEYIRFYKNDILISTPDASITNGDFASGDLSGWTDRSDSTIFPGAVCDVTYRGGTLPGALFTIPDSALNGICHARLEQELHSLSSSSTYTISIDYSPAFSIRPYFYKLKIGTTIGSQDILYQDLQNGVSTGGSLSQFTFIPGASDIFIEIDVYYVTASVIPGSDGSSLFLLRSISLFSDNSVFELATNYASNELQDIVTNQFGKTIYLVHPNHPPALLTWGGNDTDWTIKDVFFYPPPTDQDGENPPFNLTLAAVTGLNITFTSSGTYFLGGDVGRQIHNQNGNGRASIVSFVDSTHVVCDILEDFDGTGLTSGDWLLDLSPIAKLDMDQSSIGVSATVTSFYTDSARGTYVPITAITNANPAVITAVAHGLINGDKVEINTVVGMTKLNKTIWLVKKITADTFSMTDANNLVVDTTAYPAYISGGRCRKVFVDVGLDVFRATDVGRYLLINNGVMQITGYTDPQTVVAEIQKDLDSVTETSQWSIENLAWTPTKGYPRTVTLFQERIWFGGTDAHPTTIYGSDSSSFDALGVGVNDSDSLSFDISTSEVNQIQWMRGLSNNLVVGTFGAELTINSGGVAGPITSKTVSMNEVGAQSGSILQQPVILNNEILYIQRSGNRINSFVYQFQIDNYVSNDLMFLAEHMPKLRGGIFDLTYAHDPDRSIYCICNNGELLLGTYYSDQQVIAWTSFDTDGIFESIETILTGTSNIVYCVVQRTINGQIKRYIEKFDSGDGSSFIDGFSDSYLTYYKPFSLINITNATTTTIQTTTHGLVTGDKIRIFDIVSDGTNDINLSVVINGKTLQVTVVDTNTFTIPIDSSLMSKYISGGTGHKLISVVTGLNHLIGKTVQVKKDGATHADKVVANDGSITLDSAGYAVTVGLKYETNIVTLNRNVNLGLGPLQGQDGRHVRPILKLYQSCLPLLNGEFLPARSGINLMNNAIPLLTDDVEYGSFTWDTNTELTITTSDPYPLMLLGIFGSMDYGTK